MHEVADLRRTRHTIDRKHAMKFINFVLSSSKVTVRYTALVDKIVDENLIHFEFEAKSEDSKKVELSWNNLGPKVRKIDEIALAISYTKQPCVYVNFTQQ